MIPVEKPRLLSYSPLNIGSQGNVELGRLAGIHKRIELIVSTFIGVPEAMEVVFKEMRQRLGIEVK
jgi:hypothetical protein